MSIVAGRETVFESRRAGTKISKKKACSLPKGLSLFDGIGECLLLLYTKNGLALESIVP
jgi:hypothetical protein